MKHIHLLSIILLINMMGSSIAAQEKIKKNNFELQIKSSSNKKLSAMVSIFDKTKNKFIFIGKPILRVRKDKDYNLKGKGFRFFWKGKRPIDCSGVLRHALTPGEYTLHITKGYEYIPIIKDILIKPVKQNTLSVTMRRFINMPKKGWWSGDAHIHYTRKDKTENSPLFSAGKAADIHVMNVLQMGKINKVTFRQYAFGKKGSVESKDHHHKIIPGQEEPRSHSLGHVIALNISDFIREEDAYMLYDKFFRKIKSQPNTVIGFAHWGSRFNADIGLMLNAPLGLVDFVELIDFGNIVGTKTYYEFLNMGFKLSATAGSDFPWGPHIGYPRVMVYTGETNTFSQKKWFENIRAGHSFVTQGPMIDFTIDGSIPGTILKRKPGDKLKIKFMAQGHPDIGSPKKVKLIKFGKTIKWKESKDPHQTELKGEWDLQVKESCWYAIRVEAHNGSIAHTSPLYIEVNGKLTYDPKQIKNIINKNLLRITKFKELLNDESKKTRRPAEKKGLKKSKKELLKRLDEAADFYHNLLINSK